MMKRERKTIVRFFPAMVLVLGLIGLSLGSCDKYAPQSVTNEVNPLEDLPWLKNKVDEITKLSQSGSPIYVYIYQCIYGDNDTGFLINENYTETFYNHNGDVLCTDENVEKACPELNIVSKELIWEMVIPELGNIMDTLTGEWTWFGKSGGIVGGSWNNEYKSVIKILSQNADSSINYEVFVEDTLFYSGSFKILNDHWYYRQVDIHLPYWIPDEETWLMSFGVDPFRLSKDTLCFMERAADGYNYLYARIK
jgi:hypothetical protein